MMNKYEELIIQMRLAGNIHSENPEVVTAVSLAILYNESKKRDSGRYKKKDSV